IGRERHPAERPRRQLYVVTTSLLLAHCRHGAAFRFFLAATLALVRLVIGFILSATDSNVDDQHCKYDCELMHTVYEGTQHGPRGEQSWDLRRLEEGEEHADPHRR
ncbi:hypothetical protein LSAT2_006134, partial [Lamellibrachia satsuma]